MLICTFQNNSSEEQTFDSKCEIAHSGTFHSLCAAIRDEFEYSWLSTASEFLNIYELNVLRKFL